MFKSDAVPATIINVSLDQHLHQGWSMDYQGLPPVDVQIMADSDPTVARDPRRGDQGGRAQEADLARPQGVHGADGGDGRRRGLDRGADAGGGDAAAVAGRIISLIRHPLSWAGHLWPMKHPLDHLGSDGGGGVGSGPGTTVGAALALRGSGRLPVAILGDGDFLMGSNAIWTAVHYRIPLLVVIANNRSFYNDELHQERMAKERGRPVENKWIGQQMKGPEIDLAMIAQGAGRDRVRPDHAARRSGRDAGQGGRRRRRGRGRGGRCAGRARLRPGLIGRDHARRPRPPRP